MILLYHRVAVLPGDPHRIAVSPERFEAHLDLVASKYVPVPLGDLVGRGDDLPSAAVAVTFDDGYSDNLTAAKPLLESAGVPATVFVTTGRLDGEREFWWDEIEQLVLGSTSLPRVFDARIAGRRVRATLSPEPGDEEQCPPKALLLELLRALRRLGGEERDRVMADLWTWAGRSPVLRDSHRPLTAGDVAKVAAGGLIRIGAHTVSHPGLSRLPRAARLTEIADSRRRLESIVNEPVLDFAYPFGDDRRARGAVGRCGMRSACTTRPGRITSRTDPYRLPRVRVGDWDADRLARELDSI